VTQTDDQPTTPMPALGAEGEPCAECGAPLAPDQRYCLNCGRRRGPQRLPFVDEAFGRRPTVTTERVSVAPPAPPLAPPPAVAAPDRGPVVLLAGLMALLLALGVGVLLGRGGSDDAQGPPVVNVSAGPSGATGPLTSAAAFTPDWPAGTEGWTVQLATLPESSDAAAVGAAKADATGKGAADVGALRTADYASLEAGSILIYSGVFDTEKAADKALKDLQENFPDASVARVSTSADDPSASTGGDDASSDGGADPKIPNVPKPKVVTPQQLENKQKLSTEDFQEQSEELPDVVEIPEG
jgi:hypothetical protein